jgi:hypothetical protein
MRVADGRDSLFVGQRRVEMHRAAAGDEKHVLNALIGNELEDIVRELHDLLVW